MIVKVNIDNKIYEVDGSKNMLETCLSLGLNLPYFCWHPAMHSVGACRQCAIIKYKDDADTHGRITMACMEPVTDNIRISIEAKEAHEFRAGNIEALMVNHPHDCPVCDEGGECHLQDMTVMTGHNYRRYDFKKRTHANQYLGPFVNHEMNRCIQCYRCVRFYKDYAGGKDLDVFAAHDDVYFGRQEDGILENEFSGNLAEVCPTGVFTDKTLKKHFTRKWDMTNAPSICQHCSLGCNTIVSERYGSIRRILNRFNGDVNGYFLCDRGRFGYEYVNSKKRILACSKKQNGTFVTVAKAEAIHEIKNIVSDQEKLIGIGSPIASLESNFALRQLVGPANFFGGIPNAEGKLIRLIIEILKNGKVKTPSLNEVKEYDAIFILGEDVTNTAPMLALSLRQSAKNKPGERAKSLKIPIWNDAAIREVTQEETGPFYIATSCDTKLDEIATETYHAHPDNIARLGHAVAAKINKQLAAVTLDAKTELLAEAIATALLAAKKPLIVAGMSLFNEALIQSAANIAYALKDQNKDAGLVYIVPDANSIGLATLTDQFIEAGLDKIKQGENYTAIILENDLYQRIDKKDVEVFFKQLKNIIVLDCLENATTESATYKLPAGTFAEADGTIINNEGRAQRFYQVHVPENEAMSSWKWLQEIQLSKPDSQKNKWDEIIDNLVKEFPDLQPIKSIAPDADYRIGTQKIPRQPQGYSGRTAMHADKNVSEQKPPEDMDSPLSYTMEGYTGVPPAAVTPFYFSPGWSSGQAVNKYQTEVGGPLIGGNPGKRLFEPSENSNSDYFNIIPEECTVKEGEWLVIPLYHIFGSDTLSALSPPVAERVPTTYIGLNKEDALKAGISEGNIVEIFFNGNIHNLPVKIKLGLPARTAGLPKGLVETAGVKYPFFTTINKSKNE
ncbi:MAG: NADH-quinone oxidoreductase subunit NuoG [Bacteroidia bacterium]